MCVYFFVFVERYTLNPCWIFAVAAVIFVFFLFYPDSLAFKKSSEIAMRNDTVHTIRKRQIASETAGATKNILEYSGHRFVLFGLCLTIVISLIILLFKLNVFRRHVITIFMIFLRDFFL